MLLICFEIGRDRYAIDAARVIRVLPLVPLKQVPQAPLGIAGLMKVGDTCVPVVDLCAAASGRPARSRISTRLILTRQKSGSLGERMLGIIVEKATGMMKADPETLMNAGVAAPAAPYLGSVVSDREGLIQLVEIDQLISDEIRAVLV